MISNLADPSTSASPAHDDEASLRAPYLPSLAVDECPGCGWPRPLSTGCCLWCRRGQSFSAGGSHNQPEFDLEHFFDPAGSGQRVRRIVCSTTAALSPDQSRGWEAKSVVREGDWEDAWQGFKLLVRDWLSRERGDTATCGAEAEAANRPCHLSTSALDGRGEISTGEAREALVSQMVCAGEVCQPGVDEGIQVDEDELRRTGGVESGGGGQASMYRSAVTFEELHLSQELLDGLYTEMKYVRPSSIQALTLPMILSPPHKHLIAQAHNGSGKTTCFALAMLSRINLAVQAPQAICLCPTRELVVQHLAVLQRMAKYTGAMCTSTATTDTEQSKAAAGSGRSQRILPHQIVIGTHGRIKNWVRKGMLAFSRMRVMAFDEADEMLKADGFADDSLRLMKEIKRQSPACQVLLFSATFNDRVKRFAMKVLPDANQVFLPKEALSLDVIKQCRVECPSPEEKVQVLTEMVLPNCENLGQTIVFVKSRSSATELHSKLVSDGYTVTSIHGEMGNAERDRVVQEFRDGVTKLLIATDVLARGFDVSQVTLVVNFDIPTEWHAPETPAYETYLHRIGRSGRFGRRGAAFNFSAGPHEGDLLDRIATYFRVDIAAVRWNDEDAFLRVLEGAGLRG